jgi:hypothetical protein
MCELSGICSHLLSDKKTRTSAGHISISGIRLAEHGLEVLFQAGFGGLEGREEQLLYASACPGSSR